MTVEDVIDLRGLIEALWPNARQLDDQQTLIWHTVLAGLDRQDAITAVVSLNRQGREFEPTPGQILAAADHGTTALPWPQALALIRQAAGSYGRGREADALRWLAARSMHTARFAAENWRQLCTEPVDGQHGGAVESRWRADYHETCRQITAELSTGQLRPAVRDRIAQLERGAPGARGGLRQLNPITADQEGAA